MLKNIINKIFNIETNKSELKKIMIIDDHDLSVIASESAIKNSGMAQLLQSYSSVYDALTYLHDNFDNKKNLPDYIFLDFDMPVWNGNEFIEKYQSLRALLVKKIKIIILSADDRKDDTAKWPTGIIDGYLMKPLTKSSLQSIL